jgi:hypothetical protein
VTKNNNSGTARKPFAYYNLGTPANHMVFLATPCVLYKAILAKVIQGDYTPETLISHLRANFLTRKMQGLSVWSILL